MPIELEAIGTVVSTRGDVVDDDWDRETVYIELADRFDASALAGLDTFSHVEVVFFMDRVPDEKIETGARHPRNNRDWPAVGIFAQRAKNRPNRIATTICRVLRIEGLRLHVQGLDAVDRTPVLDIKPWVREFGPRGEVTQPLWMDALMRGYWR
jgi:tRNA-Thr(GGU) m(6)t(6)A37 methyltransferase TsaA